MPDYFDIYAHHADQYDRLIEREDYEHHLPQALDQILQFNGLEVIEFGAGTGRLTCMLAPAVRSIRAYDTSPAMLAVAEAKLRRMGAQNWQFRTGDHRHLPAESRSADVAISGWSLCYLALGSPGGWQEQLGRGLAEMERILRAQGTIIIIETLGTGCETPAPPADLLDYFAYLEEHGFQRTWIRTDYLFRNMQEAKDLTSFFFGEGMLERLQPQKNGVILPECTGIWRKIINNKVEK